MEKDGHEERSHGVEEAMSEAAEVSGGWTTLTQQMRGQPVSHDEAIKAARRLINSHFRNPDSARCSIPVNAYDDDVLLIDYILEQQAKGETR